MRKLSQPLLDDETHDVFVDDVSNHIDPEASELTDKVQKFSQQLELFEVDEIVRPDYNIGKYATFLFASPHTKNLTERRKIEWSVKVGDEEATAAISIAPLKDQSVPTTTTFKVLMAVIQIWRMQGANPIGTVYYSDRQLAEVAGWPYSGKIAERIRTHVDILQGTTIDWQFSFKQGSEIQNKVQKMSLINDALYIERSGTLKSQKFQANHTITLNQNLVQNMLNNVVRPINFAALRQISSDASTRLYMMLDMYLARKTKWERRSDALLKTDLGYDGKRYDNRGERKRTLERLIRDLDGKELTSGKLALEMAETADKKDWKLVARKVKRIEPNRNFIKPVRDNESAEYLADDLTPMFEGGEPKRGYLVYLCERYPENVLRDALSRARNDYRGNVKKSVGAIFRYELEQIVKGRGDLKWHKSNKS
jgi:hypothetical protein